MPCRAMQKLSVRYGIMLLCGKLEPASEIACGDIRARLGFPVVYAFAGLEFVKAVAAEGVETSPGLKFP